ncbi:carbohydrate-binding module family 1 protein [Apiospora arundinis]
MIMISTSTLQHGLAGLFAASLASAASLVQVTNFGANPSGIQMYIAAPASLPANPAIIVAMHPCGGSAQQYYNENKFGRELADKLGFIAIYPGTTKDFNCWDAATTASLTHNGGSDSQGIVNMVKYAIDKYGADPSKVYMTGSSSGAIMTNVLAGAYPDVFAAGAAFSGMPYGCLAGSPGSSPISSDPACANGQKIKSAAEWAAQVKAAYPGYTGKYPRMQLWHGTADFVIQYQDLVEEVKQWSAVHGVSFTRNVTNSPTNGYTQMIYGDGTEVVAYSGAGVGHYVPTNEQVVLDWFGITGGGSGGSPGGPTSTAGGPPRPTTSSPPVTTNPPSGGPTQTRYGQCGGSGYSGPTVCAAPYACSTANAWYAQCI